MDRWSTDAPCHSGRCHTCLPQSSAELASAPSLDFTKRLLNWQHADEPQWLSQHQICLQKAVLPPCCCQVYGAAGMMDLLVSGDVDMILYPMPLSIARIEAVDITSSVLDGGITLLVHKGDYNPPIFGFLRPFSWQVQTHEALTGMRGKGLEANV